MKIWLWITLLFIKLVQINIYIYIYWWDHPKNIITGSARGLQLVKIIYVSCGKNDKFIKMLGIESLHHTIYTCFKIEYTIECILGFIWTNYLWILIPPSHCAHSKVQVISGW